MEKVPSLRNEGQMRKNRKLNINLPKINKENQDSLEQGHHSYIPSPQKIMKLRKAYFQYKSNVRILEQSPYCSSKNKKKLVDMIKRGKQSCTKYNATSSKIYDLRTKENIKTLDDCHEIMLEYRGTQYKMVLGAHTSGELARQLTDFVRKMENQNYTGRKFKDGTLDCDYIVGFQTIAEITNLDYILSLPNTLLPKYKLALKPVYRKLIGKNIKITDFKILKCLGSGGFSTVYLARGLFNNKYYAFKMIAKEFILETDRDGIITNERFILGELRSPFITELEFAFETYNHFIFVIEYCPGGELFNQLKKVKKMSEDEAKFYFLEILTGLDYIHSKNIVYRDLKPENLLIDAEGHIKIADFGLSKPVESAKAFSYSFCGSPEYMAPEMLLKKGHNYLLDYYCLGALLYELVVGVPPYYSTNQDEIYEAILTEELGFPNHVELSDELMNLLNGLLIKEVNQRLGCLYGMKEILFHPWIGKTSKKMIEERKLIPPFIPNLENFNFDLDDIKVDLIENTKKIEEDKKKKEFETCFSTKFYYEKDNFRETLLKEKKTKAKKRSNQNIHSYEKSQRHLHHKLSSRYSSLRKSTSSMVLKKLRS